MRRFAGVLILILGIPLLLVGAAAAVYIGPDDTVPLVDEEVSTEHPAIITSPKLLPISGVNLHVSADAGDTETFVGVGHPVHVGAYVDDVPHERITTITLRGINSEITTTPVEGEEAAPAREPQGLDWWRAEASGAGAQTVEFELTEEPASIVIMRADMAVPVEVALDVSAELTYLFYATIAVAVIGLLFVIVAIRMFRKAKRARQRRDAEARAAYFDDLGAPPPLSEDTVRRSVSRVRPIAVVGTAAVVLSGCSQLPQAVDHGDEYTVVAATEEQAQEFFVRYTEINNKANADLDAETLGRVEAGTLLETSSFGYAVHQARALDPYEEFTVTPTAIAAPELGAYPMWFLATETDAEGTSTYVVARNRPTHGWRATSVAHLPAEVTPPAPTLTDGAATVPDEATIESANAVLETTAEFAQSGTAPEGMDVEAAGELAKLHQHGVQLEGFTDAMGQLSNSCRVLDPDSVRWLESEAGALAVASVTCTQVVDLVPGAYFETAADGALGTIPGGVQIAASTVTHVVTFIIEVRDDGSSAVFGGEMSPTETTYTAFAG